MSAYKFEREHEHVRVTETNSEGTFRSYTVSLDQMAQAIHDSGTCRNSRKTLKFCDCFACQLTKFLYS